MNVVSILRLAPIVAIGAIVSALSSAVAIAGPQLEDVLNTCTDINCKTQTIRGVVQSDEPFVVQAFADAGECLRIHISSATDDMRATLIEPQVGLMWTDDDSGGALQPLIVLDPTNNKGWYTILVNFWTGHGGKQKFKLQYGRYDSGNPNCQQVTNQVRFRSDDLMKATRVYADTFEKVD